jgi:hypothetical protein
VQDLALIDEPFERRGDVTVYFTDLEKQHILGQIERLLILHGKLHARKDTAARDIAVLTDALCSANIPYKHVLAGIQFLQDRDEVKTVTIGVLKSAARQSMSTEPRQRQNCPHCEGKGIVTMIRADGEYKKYLSSWACVCPNGDRPAKNTARWNGEREFTRNENRFGQIVPATFIFWAPNEPRPVIQ